MPGILGLYDTPSEAVLGEAVNPQGHSHLLKKSA